MNTRLTACTVVLILASGVASCGGTDSSSTPLSPSTSFSLPVPQPPLIGLAGNYTVPFEADRSCEQFPDSLKTRTYSAIIGYVGPSHDGTRDYSRADLSGSDFDGYHDVNSASESVSPRIHACSSPVTSPAGFTRGSVTLLHGVRADSGGWM